jgi:hypothetical protein
MAATNGPNGFGPLVRPRIEAIIHGYQDSTKAITKNAIKVCRLKKALIPSHFETSPPIKSRSHAVDVVWFPPGEKHWHGATPSTAMTHIDIQETLNGKVVDWMEKVSDE